MPLKPQLDIIPFNPKLIGSYLQSVLSPKFFCIMYVVAVQKLVMATRRLQNLLLGSLSTHVFEKRTATGGELFSP